MRFCSTDSLIFCLNIKLCTVQKNQIQERNMCIYPLSTELKTKKIGDVFMNGNLDFLRINLCLLFNRWRKSINGIAT